MIQRIISKYNDRDCVYDGGLTNHLNMGLYAMYKSGASQERLDEFAQYYIDKNHISKVANAIYSINDSSYEEYVGLKNTYSSFVPYFIDKLSSSKLEEIIRKYLNELLPGSSGDAFHGIIRMAYAVELDSIDEIAKALHIWHNPIMNFQSIIIS